MEAPGLVAGVAGLAGLFSACLEVVDKVQSYQTSGTNDDGDDTKQKSPRTTEEEDGPVKCQPGERDVKTSKGHRRLGFTVNPFVMNELDRHR